MNYSPRTMVPISSPLAAFVILPGISMLNTIIGILLSLHKVVDVASLLLILL